MPDYDVIIIGGGPGGMSALLWCNSLNLRGLLLEQADELGGQMLAMAHPIPDYPGILPKNGRELRDHFENHLRHLRLQWQIGCRIESVNINDRTLSCNGQTMSGHALVIATGARKRWLGVPGESEFRGSGVSGNATRDQALFAGREVCVIGGGDSAFDDSLILARVCPQVTLIHHSHDFRARRVWMDEVFAHPHISVVTGARVKQITGDERKQVSGVVVEDCESGEQRTIPAQGVIIQIGIAPNTEFLGDQLEFDPGGYIRTDEKQRTSAKMVYAVGDVTNPVCLSVVTAAGQGAVAAKGISETLRAINGKQ
ncbi:MAG TPA: FAD-dependent oxidoreductase [Blastocatellia bacterium]|nr:FAD-dependent oxidoreductase [Blastocatellia bacterium]